LSVVKPQTLIDESFVQHLEKQQTDLADILELFEAMLCFDAWLNQPTYWILDDTKEESKALMLKSLRQLMTMCVDRILPRPDKDENPWNFPKFHELLHLGDDMERYGASINFSAQRPELLLIPAAKLLANVHRNNTTVHRMKPPLNGGVSGSYQARFHPCTFLA
jgi:hypothetical protein